MKRFVLLLGILLAVMWGHYAQAQPGGGGWSGNRRGSGGGPSLDIASEWALLTFELKVSGDSGRALKMAFQDAWDRRRALADSMRAGGDREVFMEGMMILQGELAGEIVNILDADQLASFNDLKQRRTATNRGGGGGRRR